MEEVWDSMVKSAKQAVIPTNGAQYIKKKLLTYFGGEVDVVRPLLEYETTITILHSEIMVENASPKW